MYYDIHLSQASKACPLISRVILFLQIQPPVFRSEMCDLSFGCIPSQIFVLLTFTLCLTAKVLKENITKCHDYFGGETL